MSLTIAGGHPGSFQLSDNHPGCVLKPLSTTEATALQSLMGTSLREFCPEFHGRQERDDGEHCVIMQNLTYGLRQPVIMDIKMGTRTFEEEEVLTLTKRMDLLEKMMKLDPEEATKQEREEGITKLRYMQFREKLCTTAKLGFRIEAVSCGSSEGPSLSKAEAQTIHDRSKVLEVLSSFVKNRADIARSMLHRLKELRVALTSPGSGSDWLKGHELIGSSLLFVYDLEEVATVKGGAWMIDFAHTHKHDQELTHTAPWAGGNHEDGYLSGLDNLIACFESMPEQS